MLQLGADPSIKDRLYQTPFKVGIVLSHKAARDAFRMYMSTHPEQYDWKIAGVAMAGGLSRDDVANRAATKKATKKESRKRAKDRKKEQKQNTLNENKVLDALASAENQQREQVYDVQIQMKMAKLAKNVAMELGWSEGELLSVVASAREDSVQLLTTMQKLLTMGEDTAVVVERMFQSQSSSATADQGNAGNVKKKKKKRKKKGLTLIALRRKREVQELRTVGQFSSKDTKGCCCP